MWSKYTGNTDPHLAPPNTPRYLELGLIRKKNNHLNKILRSAAEFLKASKPEWCFCNARDIAKHSWHRPCCGGTRGSLLLPPPQESCNVSADCSPQQLAQWRAIPIGSGKEMISGIIREALEYKKTNSSPQPSHEKSSGIMRPGKGNW